MTAKKKAFDLKATTHAKLSASTTLPLSLTVTVIDSFGEITFSSSNQRTPTTGPLAKVQP